MTRKSSQIRPDRIVGAICDLQSALRLYWQAGGSAISLGKGCHGNDLWIFHLTVLQAVLILRENYPRFLYVSGVFFCSSSLYHCTPCVFFLPFFLTALKLNHTLQTSQPPQSHRNSRQMNGVHNQQILLLIFLVFFFCNSKLWRWPPTMLTSRQSSQYF